MNEQKYSDRQWAFIRTYEEQAPEMSNFLFRLRQHEAKEFEPDCGMTADDIQRCEEIHREMFPDDDCRYTPEDAWECINENLSVEEMCIIHHRGLRARAEAAWDEFQASGELP